MKDYSSLDEFSPKKLRTLRNNLNNRIESFKLNNKSLKELSKSHALYGLDFEQCENLLAQVKKLLVKK